jgi:hypothetical protein
MPPGSNAGLSWISGDGQSSSLASDLSTSALSRGSEISTKLRMNES